ncbi:unnamed protein product [Prorocentrum cordatum]|uniref:Uncharacterized protein n=1 Tax=Prorocentrum cordatum TaxID=2364126 RepID=A0ABN9QQK6_9DINO|nr:unnamed protein product [Polarella glacialis]
MARPSTTTMSSKTTTSTTTLTSPTETSTTTWTSTTALTTTTESSTTVTRTPTITSKPISSTVSSGTTLMDTTGPFNTTLTETSSTSYTRDSVTSSSTVTISSGTSTLTSTITETSSTSYTSDSVTSSSTVTISSGTSTLTSTITSTTTPLYVVVGAMKFESSGTPDEVTYVMTSHLSNVLGVAGEQVIVYVTAEVYRMLSLARRLSSVWNVDFEITAPEYAARQVLDLTIGIVNDSANFTSSMQAAFESRGMNLTASSFDMATPSIKPVTVTQTTVSGTSTSTTATSITATSNTSVSSTTATSTLSRSTVTSTSSATTRTTTATRNTRSSTSATSGASTTGTRSTSATSTTSVHRTTGTSSTTRSSTSATSPTTPSSTTGTGSTTLSSTSASSTTSGHSTTETSSATHSSTSSTTASSPSETSTSETSNTEVGITTASDNAALSRVVGSIVLLFEGPDAAGDSPEGEQVLSSIGATISQVVDVPASDVSVWSADSRRLHARLRATTRRLSRSILEVEFSIDVLAGASAAVQASLDGVDMNSFTSMLQRNLDSNVGEDVYSVQVLAITSVVVDASGATPIGADHGQESSSIFIFVVFGLGCCIGCEFPALALFLRRRRLQRGALATEQGRRNGRAAPGGGLAERGRLPEVPRPPHERHERGPVPVSICLPPVDVYEAQAEWATPPARVFDEPDGLVITLAPSRTHGGAPVELPASVPPLVPPSRPCPVRLPEAMSLPTPSSRPPPVTVTSMVEPSREFSVELSIPV